MKIHICEPDGPYKCVINTEAMEVVLEEVFLGVALVTEDGHRLSVSMRDNGFEVHYLHDGKEFDGGWIELKDGTLTVTKRR